jgi:hypothetical protein
MTAPTTAHAEHAGMQPRRLLLILLLVSALLIPMLPVRDASAGRAWCRTDPIVLIEGRLASILVSAPLLTAVLTVNGPTQIVVYMPDDVKGQLHISDLGFLRGVKFAFRSDPALRWTEEGIELRIEVYVPGRDSSMPVMVEFAPGLLGLLAPDRATGTANQWITLNTIL